MSDKGSVLDAENGNQVWPSKKKKQIHIELKPDNRFQEHENSQKDLKRN